MKKLFALLLVLVLAFACATAATAEGEEIKVAFITQSLTNASQAYAWTQFEKYAPEYGFTVQVFDEEYNAENGDRAIRQCIADGYDAIIPAMLSGLSDLLIGIVVILVLSASMSTLSSLVLTSSSTLTLDFLKDRFLPNLPERRQVFLMRCLIVAFIAISVVLALVQYHSSVTFIAQLMGVSWGALAGAFLAPFLYGLYWKRTTKAACWCCFLFSAGVMLANIFFGGSFPALLQSPINAGAFCMLAGLVLVPLVSLATPRPDRDLVDSAFACYDQQVLVPQREALGDPGRES